MTSRYTYFISALVGALLLLPGNAMAGVDCYGELSGAKNVSQAAVSEDGDQISISLDGFQLGVGGGCDVGIPATTMFVGAFVRYDFSNVDTRAFDVSVSAEDVLSGGLRVGVNVNEGTKVYAIGGLAHTDFKFGSTKLDAQGVFYGAGLEIQFTGLGIPLALFGQWEHTDWGDEKIEGSKVKPDSDAFRAGIRTPFTLLK